MSFYFILIYAIYIAAIYLAIYIADLEEMMGKVKWGGLKLGEKRIYTQAAYADDIVLLAEEEDEMRS